MGRMGSFMQRFLDKYLALFGSLILIGGLAVVGKIVYEVASGNGLGTFLGGARGVKWNWVSALVTLIVIAVVMVVSQIVAWWQRRNGWHDENFPR